MLQREKVDGGMMDGLSGLMVGRKDIHAKIKDFRTIKRISRDVEEKLAVDRLRRVQMQEDMSEESESLI